MVGGHPRLTLALVWSALASACGGVSAGPAAPHADGARPDAALVAKQPGAWFDAYGNLTVVGPGKRLRLVLSAPISACNSAFESAGAPAELAARASLPFHVLSDACRDAHPAILLAEESETASPSELELSYHEVARCAAAEWDLGEGWVPKVVEDSDPCPLALGAGWRLPSTAELHGLTVDDRKAIAGALFDPDDGSAFGDLLLYARAESGGVSLVTLSPNLAEQAPTLSDTQRARPFYGAALRCVRTTGPALQPVPPPPALPNAVACLNQQRKAQARATAQPSGPLAPELQKLKLWLDDAQRTPTRLHDEAQLRELSQLLASPALERIAREEREERALTERYAELAEALDDPAVSSSERERRHAEFARLRQRLGGNIVASAEASGAERTALALALARLQPLLEAAAASGKSAQKLQKGAKADYQGLLGRVHELGEGKASAP